MSDVPTAKITKRSVDAMTAGAATAFLWDDDLKGFGLRVTPAGVKAYIFQYRTGGRTTAKKRHTIGRHGSPWTPATAREEAERLARLAAIGIDPTEEKRELQRQTIDLAFNRYVDLFSEHYLAREWKNAASVKRMLVSRAVEVLGGKPMPRITRSDIAAVMDRSADRPATARHLHAVLRKMFRWAVDRGDIDRSPFEAMTAPRPVAARDRVLTDAELLDVWTLAAGLEFPFCPLIRLLLATGQRREEVAGLDWAELDQDAATWLLPAGRAKNGVAHVVPLNEVAIGLLDVIVAVQKMPGGQWPRSGLVFSTTGRTAPSGFSKAKARLDKEIGEARAGEDGSPVPITPWRLHDIRRTVATGLQRLGVRFEVTEAVLNHVSGARGGIAGVYQRHSWADEKREALKLWGDHLHRVVSGERA